MTRPLAAIVLAAGRSRRMRSSIPKPLHPVGGLPMLAHVLEACRRLEPEILTVVTPASEHPVSDFVRSSLPSARIAVQEQPDGTASAFLAAAADLDGFPGDILVVYGDTPLLRAETLRASMSFTIVFLVAFLMPALIIYVCLWDQGLNTMYST